MYLFYYNEIMVSALIYLFFSLVFRDTFSSRKLQSRSWSSTFWKGSDNKLNLVSIL